MATSLDRRQIMTRRYCSHWTGRTRLDVELENLRRYRQRRARVWNVDDAADAPFDRCRSEDRIGLRPGEPEFLQVRDCIEAGLPISNVNVEIVLLARLVYGDPLEYQVR